MLADKMRGAYGRGDLERAEWYLLRFLEEREREVVRQAAKDRRPEWARP